MLSAIVVLYVYHAAFKPITIYDPVGCLAMMLLAWGSGVAVGMVMQAARPWWPAGISMLATIYQRMNMIFSGKMFVANAAPAIMHHRLSDDRADRRILHAQVCLCLLGRGEVICREDWADVSDFLRLAAQARRLQGPKPPPIYRR